MAPQIKNIGNHYGKKSFYKLLTDSLTSCMQWWGGSKSRLISTFIDSLISCYVALLWFWQINGFYTLFVIHYCYLEVFWSWELEWGVEFQNVRCKFMYAQVCRSPDAVYVSHFTWVVVISCVVAHRMINSTNSTLESGEGKIKDVRQFSCRYTREWRTCELSLVLSSL